MAKYMGIYFYPKGGSIVAEANTIVSVVLGIRAALNMHVPVTSITIFETSKRLKVVVASVETYEIV